MGLESCLGKDKVYDVIKITISCLGKDKGDVVGFKFVINHHYRIMFLSGGKKKTKLFTKYCCANIVIPLK